MPKIIILATKKQTTFGRLTAKTITDFKVIDQSESSHLQNQGWELECFACNANGIEYTAENHPELLRTIAEIQAENERQELEFQKLLGHA